MGVVPGFMGFPSLSGTLYDRARNAEANDWANEAGNVNRGWQEMMSNTAHQREVKDLRAAGLNPILSATGGAGASTPGGGASEVIPMKETEGIMTGADFRKMNEEIDLIKAQSEVAATAADVNRAQADKTKKEAGILGPKSFIFNKLEEQLKSVPKIINKVLPKDMSNSDAVKLHNSCVQNPVKVPGGN